MLPFSKKVTKEGNAISQTRKSQNRMIASSKKSIKCN